MEWAGTVSGKVCEARFTTTPANDGRAQGAGDTAAMLKKIEGQVARCRGTSDEIAQRAQNDPVLLTYPQFVGKRLRR
jgi:hypothetical protein